MQYWRAVRFPFTDPRWWRPALFGAVCLLVPVAGPMVFMGYLAEMIERCHRSGRDEPADFDLDRLMDYLKRGVWPFLAVLIAGLAASAILVPVGMVLMFLPVAVGAGHSGEEGAVAGMLVGYLLYSGFLLAVGLPLSLLYTPLLIGGALGRSLSAAFAWSFILEFLRRVWWETLLATVFVWLVGLAALAAGMLLCCVGVYPAAALMMVVHWHLYWQLYELYLERGGAPVFPAGRAGDGADGTAPRNKLDTPAGAG